MDNMNRVNLCGQVLEAPTFSHSNHGVCFYKFPLRIPRLSGQNDDLTVIITKKQWEKTPVVPGEKLHITGQLRSYNNKSGVGSRLVLSVFALEIFREDGLPQNEIWLSGVLCKAPTLRRTPLGREICDVILAVNRRYGRADYLPCIAWGAVAIQVAGMSVGQRFSAQGRIQSRTYTKSVDGAPVQRCAYEVSIMHPLDTEEMRLL